MPPRTRLENPGRGGPWFPFRSTHVYSKGQGYALAGYSPLFLMLAIHYASTLRRHHASAAVASRE